jgi:hypothetical protein
MARAKRADIKKIVDIWVKISGEKFKFVLRNNQNKHLTLLSLQDMFCVPNAYK